MTGPASFSRYSLFLQGIILLLLIFDNSIGKIFYYSKWYFRCAVRKIYNFLNLRNTALPVESVMIASF